MPLAPKFAGATLPDGAEKWEEDVDASDRVRAYETRHGGAMADGGGRKSNAIEIEWRIGAGDTDALEDLKDTLHRVCGEEFGWLEWMDDRRIWATPTRLTVEYPETLGYLARVEQQFVAADPRWESIASASTAVLPSLQYVHGSELVSVTGTARAETEIYYWPVYGATELPDNVTITNRYANLLYNADFDSHAPDATMYGLAEPWSTSHYAQAAYEAFLIPDQQRQYLDIDSAATEAHWVTAAIIPYAPTRNEISPTTDSVAWSATWDISQIVGDWRFYMRLHALAGTAFGAATLQTVTSAIYGTTGAGVTVAGTNHWAGRIGVTMTVTGGLSAHCRQLRPEWVWVGATGAGTVGGGRMRMEEPYVRTDGVAEYDYREHQVVEIDGIGAAGNRAAIIDGTEREVDLWIGPSAATTGIQYTTDASEFWELAPGSNEIHVEVNLTNTQAVTGGVTTYPCSTENLTYVEYTDRWWS